MKVQKSLQATSFTQQSETEKNTIVSLLPELLAHIFSFLSVIDLTRIRLVNRRFKDISDTHILSKDKIWKDSMQGVIFAASKTGLTAYRSIFITKFLGAKEAAQKNGYGTSINIKKYGIKDEGALTEIAIAAVKENVKGTINCLEEYGIQDENALVRIFKAAAMQDHTKVLDTDFHGRTFKNKQDVIDIIMLATPRNGEDTSRLIKDFKIGDEKILIEIAKLSAQQNGEATSRYIKNYGIKDRAALDEIALLAGEQNAEGTLKYLSNYGRVTIEIFYQILKMRERQLEEPPAKRIRI